MGRDMTCSLVCAAALLVAACTASVDPRREAVPTIPTVAANDPGATLNDQLEALASEVPGFGGLFITDSSVVVYLTDPASQAGRARQTLLARLAARLGGHPLVTAALRKPMEIRRGSYDFRQLARWLRALNARGLPDGVVFSGIDERVNALGFGVKDEASRARLGAALAAVGIPRHAYKIEVVEPPGFLHGKGRRVKERDGGGEKGPQVRRGFTRRPS